MVYGGYDVFLSYVDSKFKTKHVLNLTHLGAAGVLEVVFFPQNYWVI